MTRSPGVIAAIGLGLLLLACAVSIDVPKAGLGFKGDEATYYSLAHSLARDGDFTFERKDLVRVWEEYSGGPEGIFLKRGKKIRFARGCITASRSSTRLPRRRSCSCSGPTASSCPTRCCSR